MGNSPEVERVERESFIRICLGMAPTDFVDYVATKAKPNHLSLVPEVLRRAPLDYVEKVKTYVNGSADLLNKWSDILRQNSAGVEKKY